MTPTHTLIYDFVNNHSLMLLATSSSKGQPEAAIVNFSATNDLCLVFDTFSTYRKYANLQLNPNVACVIGWDSRITVQYEGTTNELVGQERAEMQKFHLTKHPKHNTFFTKPESRLFKITPTWVRYKDYNQTPWLEHTLTF